MASLIESLISVLNNENIEYEKLLNLSVEKTSALVKADIEQLQELVAKEQLLINRINSLDLEREENTKDIADVLNIPLKDLKVEVIINLLHKQPNEQEQLVRAHRALKKTVEQLVKINDHNKVLLSEALEMVEFEINLAKSSMMAPEIANYSKAAHNTMAQNPLPGSFDAKQ